MHKLRTPTREEAGVLIAILAAIFGAWVRLFPASIAGFPINDGGLFSIMIGAIQANHWMLPTYFQYNGQSIPFAYPPLAFYFGAFVSNLLHLSSIEVVRWLPAVATAGTVPAFYYLAKVVFKSTFQAGIAALVFAFTPRAMTWLIMGGGLTRSFGMLFLLLSLASIHQLFDQRDRRYLAPSIAFSSLVVLTHPEAAVHTISAAALFWLFKGRNKGSVVHGLVVGLGTIIVTSLWWIPALVRLGAGPFLDAAQTGSQSALSILYPFILTLTDEPLLTVVAVLGLVGFFVCLRSRRYILPVWYFLPFLVDPRSGATYAMIPLAMMAGLALSDVILPTLVRDDGDHAGTPGPANIFRSGTATTLLSILTLYLLGGAVYFGTQLAGSAVSGTDRTALDWIRANTEPNSRFLVMTGEDQPLCDGLQEWFPALTGRIGITTIQGDEWLPNGKYAQAVALQNAVQSCTSGLPAQLPR